eukprot:m.988309 g.988309  ORF g.988309 m.988309 type:complete len:213 (-) comp23993_c0_seq2:502-1140(-)
MHRTSYVDFIAKHYKNAQALDPSQTVVPADHCGPAKFLVSCPHATPFATLCATLEDWCARRKLDPKRTYVWMCVLCTNHMAPTTRGRSHARVLQERMREIPTLVPVLTSWVPLTYALRRWCLYELLVAVTQEKAVDCALAPDTRQALKGMLATGGASQSTIEAILNTISSAKAALPDGCAPADKCIIDEYLTRHAGNIDILRGQMSKVMLQL